MKKRRSEEAKVDEMVDKTEDNDTLEGENLLQKETSGKQEATDDGVDPLETYREQLGDNDEALEALEAFAKSKPRERLSAILSGMAAKGTEHLASSLIISQQKKKQKKKVPSGAALGRVGELISLARRLLKAVGEQTFTSMHIGVKDNSEKTSNEWLHRVQTELDNLALLESGDREARLDVVTGIENNLSGIAAELASASALGDDTLINNDVDYIGPSTREDAKDGDTEVRKLDIDLISADGKTWVEVKDKKTFGLESSNWTKEVEPKAQKMLAAAKQHKEVQELIFRFTKGVSKEVKDALESMGFTVEVVGEVIDFGE